MKPWERVIRGTPPRGYIFVSTRVFYLNLPVLYGNIFQLLKRVGAVSITVRELCALNYTLALGKLLGGE